MLSLSEALGQTKNLCCFQRGYFSFLGGMVLLLFFFLAPFLFILAQGLFSAFDFSMNAT